ncbi:HAMP domain-containing methyl-accepting chemotaxis protein [Pseudorhodoplanes sp.]|uniref:methyl-accepting chemotaxis protein n=1 Tax=Pseudorhodoplanes sp. TaxID=1934341 RepID=UPI002B663525|nr:HAMP domain-containing methyl-accepting chemotaxis protein [Pseudorhodoplanes sp.]HWV51372.1 HAMP domain-containing methyl-accepting chemotaxis protein [Pseudorhodoplanes sp.]
MTFPRLTIAAKLYAIFALLATAALILALAAVVNAKRHSALTDEFRASFNSARQIERAHSLINAVVMEARALVHAPDAPSARRTATQLIANNDRLGDTATELQWDAKPEDKDKIEAFAERIKNFQQFHRELARLGAEVGPEAARALGENETDRTGLSRDIEGMAQVYSQRSQQLYAAIDEGVRVSAIVFEVLTLVLLLLAAAGAAIIWRSCIRPLKAITRVTEQVADGQTDVVVPYRGRRDEIGALATSIGVFQAAMRHNKELNKTVNSDAEARRQRQDQIAAEIETFSAEVEGTLSELMKMSSRAKKAATELGQAVEITVDRTGRATQSSEESNANVRDIASAADELAMSVLEIERQVSQSHDIAMKAVTEAEATNETVQELSEAAGRIGDVIRMINDIAEQTNLLALNATIEAARAGEAGRGFAVVAGEVKALAGQTAKATEEIGAQIAGMQHATDRSIAAISAIKTTIREIGDISSAIAAAVTEQGAATQEIARSVETASRRSAETTTQIAKVTEATEISRTHSVAAQYVSDTLDGLASRMRNQIDQFFERLRAA